MVVGCLVASLLACLLGRSAARARARASGWRGAGVRKYVNASARSACPRRARNSPTAKTGWLANEHAPALKIISCLFLSLIGHRRSRCCRARKQSRSVTVVVRYADQNHIAAANRGRVRPRLVMSSVTYAPSHSQDESISSPLRNSAEGPPQLFLPRLTHSDSSEVLAPYRLERR